MSEILPFPVLPPNEQDAVQNAVTEVRHAALHAREFADLFENYAGLLASHGHESQIGEAHLKAMEKLQLLNEAVESSNDWIAKSRIQQ